MKLLNPTIWAVLAWLFFLMLCCFPLSGPVWFWNTGMIGMVVSALVALVTGIVQRRRHPGASRSWQYWLASLFLIIAVTWFLLPALG